MPKAEHAHTTSPRRRALLAGTGLAAAVTLLTRGAPAAALPHPDARLLALCAEFCALEAEHRAQPDCATYEEDEVRLADAEDIMDRQGEIADALLDLPARTLDGHQAIAAALTAWAEPYDYHRGDYMAPKLVGALLLGLVGRPIHPDGELPPT